MIRRRLQDWLWYRRYRGIRRVTTDSVIGGSPEHTPTADVRLIKQPVGTTPGVVPGDPELLASLECSYPEHVREAVELFGSPTIDGRKELARALQIEARQRPTVPPVKLLRSIIEQMKNEYSSGTDVPRRVPFTPSRPRRQPSLAVGFLPS